jgi:hypothetical protein
MEEAVCRPLVQALARVPDFRQFQGQRYTLVSVLALACVATLCGYNGYCQMAEWGRLYGDQFAYALGFNGRTPAAGTFHNIFRRLDRNALEKALMEWAESVLVHFPDARALAIDGKTLRGSAKQGALDVHLLSVVSHALGLTVFQKAVDRKTNEIGAILEVLSAIALEGRIITVDALLTQKSVAEAILEKKGTS